MMPNFNKPRFRDEPEHELQSACVKWFDYQYPRFSQLFFAIPNGGKRNKTVAAKIKAEGVRAGVADMFLAIPATDKFNFTRYCGLFIEFKAENGRQTDLQKSFQKAAESQEYAYHLIYNFDDFKKIIQLWLSK